MSRLLHFAAAAALAAAAAASLVGLATAEPARGESAHHAECPRALCMMMAIF